MGRILKRRNELEKSTLGEGLRYGIDKLEEAGVFWVQRSWMHISEDRQDFKIFRYEDLACDNRSFLKQLFDYLNIVMPEKEFLTLYDRHKFEKYSVGRNHGVADAKSHYRKGVSGDWKIYFDRSTMAYFRQLTGDLLEVLRYQE